MTIEGSARPPRRQTLNVPMKIIAGGTGGTLLAVAVYLVVNGVIVGLIGVVLVGLLLMYVYAKMTKELPETSNPMMAVNRSPLIAAPAAPLSVWNGVEVGTTMAGRFVIRLRDGSVQIAGQSRSGKSVLLHGIIAACAMDPNVRLSVHDGKGTLSYMQYADIAKVDRSADPAKFLAFLTELDREIERRYQRLADMGEEKLTEAIYASGEMPLFVAVVDEIGQYTVTMPNRKIGQHIVHLLSSIAAKGAGAGVLLVLSAQRTSVEFIPAKIRANISQRIAFRVADRIESDLALGPGSAKKGRDASTIPRGEEYRGTAWADIDGIPPVKFRSDLIEYKDTLAIAKKALSVRGPVDSSLTQPLDDIGRLIGDDDLDDDELDDFEDALEDDVLTRDRDLLDDIKIVWRRDEERLHLATILERLKDLDGTYYDGWTQNLFGRRLRDAGLAQYKKQMTIGNKVNNWGLEASALYAGDEGKDPRQERRERELAALEALSDHERMLYEARIDQLKRETNCAYCGKFMDRGEVTIDHITPLAEGGSAHPVNLCACCRSCNSSKGAKPLSDWLATRN